MNHPRVLLTLVLLLSTALPAVAQSGGLQVKVLDAAGRPVPGAAVTLTSALRLVGATTLNTDAAGVVTFPVLKAGGGYAVAVSKQMWNPVRLTDLRVRSEQTQRVDVALFPEMTERIDVTSGIDVVELDKSETSTALSGVFLEDLPIQGRLYQNALTFAPGVLDSDQDGNPNVHGARSTDFTTYVNGVSNSDPLTGEWLSYVNLESIEELEVITAGAGAEFGRAQGGFGTILQKQGSDDFEGVAGILWSSSRLDGNGATSVKPPPFSWVQPYAQVSGPIVAGRLWYRLSHEWIDREDPINLLNSVAVVSRRQMIHSDQLTWQISPRNKLSLQSLRDPLSLENVGVSSSVPAVSSRTLERGGSTWTLSWTAALSARLLVDSLVAYQDHAQNTLPSTVGVPNDCLRSARFPALERAQCFDQGKGLTSGSSALESRDDRQRLTVRSQATFYLGEGKRIGHRFKFGFGIENERYFRRLDRGLDMTFFTVSTGFGAPRVGYAQTRLSVPQTSNARAVGTNVGVYLEDQLRLGAAWSLVLGVRADQERIDSRGFAPFEPEAEAGRFLELFASGLTPDQAAASAFTAYEGFEDYLFLVGGALESRLGDIPPLTGIADQSSGWGTKRRLDNTAIDHVNVSPRLSIAWDPTGDGKTKLALSAGRYYDKIFLSVPLLGMEPVTTSITFTADPRNDTWIQTGFVGGVEPTASTTMISPVLRTPYQDELALTFERELWPETSVRLTLVKRAFRDQLQDIDVNHLPADYGACRYVAEPGQNPVSPRPGSGGVVIDPYTGESYVDTDPGPGDGRLDDCTGLLTHVGSILTPQVLRPDGLPDLYAQNPAWGEILLVGNFNTARYRGAVLELVRRLYRNWEVNASYTWSRAIGDAEQFDQLLGNDRSQVEKERGFLAYDQRHVAKIAATSVTPWGFRLGTSVRFESGLPYSILEPALAYYGAAPQYGFGSPVPALRYLYTEGTRNGQRNRAFWNVDVRVAKEVVLGKDRSAAVAAEIFNLLNDDTLSILEIRSGVAEAVRRFGRRFQVGVRIAF